ncbi:hypothetical protein [Pedobacter sp. B4-66]|uniref:hypothetical protein n=1 Tax=Pedobacter sp. B4-66 TaxID=2817280 RepID=UPI001BD96516|nr:hypothetical protein [Pedobacter sp. B4-66]
MTVDEIYLNMAQGISNAIDENNWTKAKLDIEIVGDGVVGYTGDYELNSTSHDLSVRKIPRDIRNWLKELHRITTEGGKNKWNRAVFALEPQGKFDMEFVWDQELHDEIEKLS